MIQIFKNKTRKFSWLAFSKQTNNVGFYFEENKRKVYNNQYKKIRRMHFELPMVSGTRTGAATEPESFRGLLSANKQIM